MDIFLVTQYLPTRHRRAWLYIKPTEILANLHKHQKNTDNDPHLTTIMVPYASTRENNLNQHWYIFLYHQANQFHQTN